MVQMAVIQWEESGRDAATAMLLLSSPHFSTLFFPFFLVPTYNHGISDLSQVDEGN